MINDDTLSAYERAQLKWGMSSIFTSKVKSEQGDTDIHTRVVAIGVGVIRQPDMEHPGILEIVAREIIDKPTECYFHAIVDLSDPGDELARLTPSFPDVAPFLTEFIGSSPIVIFDDEKERTLLDAHLILCGFPPFADEMVFGVDAWVNRHMEEEDIDFEGFVSSFIIDIESNKSVLTGTRQYVDLLSSIFMEIRRQEEENA